MRRATRARHAIRTATAVRQTGSPRLAWAVAALLAKLVAPAVASANGFVVTTVGDASDPAIDGTCGSAGVCTLRAAIEEADATTAPDLVAFSLPRGSTIELTGPLPALSHDVSIVGPGGDAGSLVLRRDSGGDYRVLTVSAGATASVSRLTIATGLERGSLAEGRALGGGIANYGTLSLDSVNVVGNAAIRTTAGADGDANAVGGGIGNVGTLHVTSSTVSDNHAIADATDSNARRSPSTRRRPVRTSAPRDRRFPCATRSSPTRSAAASCTATATPSRCRTASTSPATTAAASTGRAISTASIRCSRRSRRTAPARSRMRSARTTRPGTAATRRRSASRAQRR